MIRLLVNDFRLNAVFVFWVFLFFNAQLFLMAKLGVLGRYAVGGIQSAGIVFASVMVVAVFLREEQHKGQIVIRSLPISHGKIVCARYLSISLFVLACALYGFFYWVVVGSSIQNRYFIERFHSVLGDPGIAIMHSLIARALATSAAVAIAVPLIVRYGTFWRILIGYMVLTVGWSRSIPSLLRWSESESHIFGSVGWVLVAVVLIIAIIAASIRLSIWLYARKEL
jgi:hypothetical protein